MRKFKTESKKLLDLMINSIYTNREIFLRELISNASDAVDKLYFLSLTDPDTKLSEGELRIQVSYDKEARTVTVSDTGIGMNEADLDKNLGTIAHSGSLDFKAENDEAQGEDVDIIGQFGVGFYSSFMVAKKVKVVSKAYGDDQAYTWESNGVDGYTLGEGERDEHGTDVILTLRDNTDEENYDEFLDDEKLTFLIRRYSNYVRYPIKMEVTGERALPKPEDAGDDYQTEYETYTAVETINSMIPIWKRKKSEVSDEDYNEFYKTEFHDFTDPIRTISVHAEGTLTYDALLFIPGHRPFDLFSKEYKKGLSLYSSNVLIMEKCEELIPDCFGFVKGIVDSQDLTLNISRETLQSNSQLRAIARKVEKKIKSELEDMRDDDRETYESFFENFGRTMKYALYESYGQQKDLLADLLLFYSAEKQKMITFDEYIESMKEDQEAIYYASGESQELLAKMPMVKAVLNKGYDVLLCNEDVDEFCIGTMQNYKEKMFKNVAGGDLDLDTEEEKKEQEKIAEDNKGLFIVMEAGLRDKVKKVTVSSRLADAPAGITSEGPISLEMERILSQNPDGSDAKTQRVLELNPNHKVFETLQQAMKDGEQEKVQLYGDILYDQALLIEGLPIEDPVEYAAKISKLLV